MVPSAAAAVTPPHQVVAVVPAKRLAFAKSRIALPPDQQRELALAFAVDTISSLSGSPLITGGLS